MRNTIEQPLCFERYDPTQKKCQKCLVVEACLNKQAGFNAAGVLEAMDSQRQYNERFPEPKWVEEWDDMTKQEMDLLKIEDPKKWQEYQRRNNFYQSP